MPTSTIGGILLLGTWRCHAQFQAFLARELAPRWTSDRPRIEFYADLLEAAWLLDLDPALPVLAPHYSVASGKIPRGEV